MRFSIAGGIVALGTLGSGCDYDAFLGDYVPTQSANPEPASPAPTLPSRPVPSGAKDAGEARDAQANVSSADSAPPSDAGDSGYAACAGASVVCESFDGDLEQYEVRLLTGELSIEPAHDPIGGGALRVFAEGKDALARVVFPVSPVLNSGKLYARFNAFVPSSTVLDSWVVVFEWYKGLDAKVSLDFVGETFQVNISPGGVSQGGLIPKDRWFCLVLEAELSETGEVALFLDGQEVLRGTGDTVPHEGIDELFVSAVTSSRQTTPIEYYIDEFKASTSELGCP